MTPSSASILKTTKVPLVIANIAFPRYSRIGAGAVNELPSLIDSLGLRRPLLVTDAYLTQTGAVDRLLTLLRGAGINAAVFDGTVPDPTTESLDRGVEALRAHLADCVIGFGGGSPMDSAKALAVLASQGGPMRKFKAPSSYGGSALPIIAIPMPDMMVFTSAKSRLIMPGTRIRSEMP